MRILIIDRDRDTGAMLQSRFESEGHEAVVETVRKSALDRLETESFDIIAIDPAPLPSARQITLPLRWQQTDDYRYLIQLGHDPDPAEVVRCGLNDMIAKPFDWNDIQATLRNAQRLTDFMRHLRESEDLPTEGMTFSKRSFCKLVLSALDRAYRYGEQAYLLLIRITNIETITKVSGEQAAGEVLAATDAYLTKLHRMSDFLGRTDVAEHALLLLRPAVDTEPQDAVERFAIALQEFQAQQPVGLRPAYTVALWALPSGAVTAERQLGAA